MTHICFSKLTIIGSDNGLWPGRCQAIVWTNARLLFIGPLGTNFNEILIKIHTLSFKNFHLKMLSGKWRPFCPSLNNVRCMTQIWRLEICSSKQQKECFVPKKKLDDVSPISLAGWRERRSRCWWDVSLSWLPRRSNNYYSRASMTSVSCTPVAKIVLSSGWDQLHSLIMTVGQIAR